MMRASAALLIIILVTPSDASSAVRGKRMPECMSNEAWDRLAQRLQTNPPYLTSSRLPKGMRIGRCLLTVDGKTFMNGRCAYIMERDGSFVINGPRQIYGGIDYPECFQGAATFTTDYFAYVDWIDQKEMDAGSPGPGWEATWNEAIGSNHADAFLGPVVRNGACYTNKKTKICLWKK